MKKKLLTFMIIVFSLILCGCFQNNASEITNSYSYSQNESEIDAFNLLSPYDNQVVNEVPTFNWEKANNAETYTLEIASSSNFSSEDTVYIKKTGIITTSFKISSNLKYKDTTYYWRVIAKNLKKTKKCNDEFKTFFLQSKNVEEVLFEINYADEWAVHNEGSKANISIDNSTFFNNDKKSLVIKFNEEDTNKGIPASDGWIVVSHQQEVEMYGVDSFYFNFYYSGQNSRIFLRVVDEDNEYYHCEIKLANNVKQTIIMRFDEFELRTKGGTTIANQKFDYNYIKCVELVFEETFGDGICMLNDLKAVSYDKYKNMFIDKVNFNEINKKEVIKDNYEFNVNYSDDGKAFDMAFNNDVNGYGFVKFNVNKFMISNDALKIKIKYTGANNANILIRLIEEDKDRWVYKQACSTIINDEYIIIPYNAFTLSEYNGDGNRQFYYLRQIQFGIENIYSKGNIEFSDISFCKLEDNVLDLFLKDLNNSPIIDDFNDYSSTAKIYYKWQLSQSNKDEAMTLNNDMSFKNNNQCVKLTYKSDMGPAYYGLKFINSPSNYNAISFNANDASVKFDDVVFNHIEKVSAKMMVSLYLSSDEEYIYVIDSLNKYWTNYTINFSAFKLNGEALVDSLPLESVNIVGVKFGLQYYYYDKNNNPYPVYLNNNAVYFDDICFTNGTTNIKELSNKITPIEDNPNVCIVDDFESYNNESLKDYWAMNNNLAYSDLSLVNEDNNQYMKMKYKGNSDSVAYSFQTLFSEEAKAKAISLRLKGDNKATVYINFYVNYANGKYKYRATLKNVSDSWYTYTIGFSNFVQVEGSTLTLSNKLLTSIYKISFGIVNYSTNDESYVYVDDIKFDYSVSYTINSKT